MAGQLRKGDIGSTIRVTVKENGQPFDISTATVKTLKLQKPDGTVAEFAMAFNTDGVDGKLKYVTAAASDLDQAGPCVGQVFLDLPAGKWHTDPFTFTVGDVLS